MNDLIKIANSEISVKEYKGQRVVTFKDIDMVHERPEGTARKRFADNRKHFVEGEDFFVLKPKDLENVELSEKRTLENVVLSNFGTALLTEQGYLMLVKTFTDDLAWKVQRQLVNGYFRTRSIVNEELSPATKLMLQMANQIAESELKSIEAKKIAEKALEATENIKDAVRPVFDNWREEINKKIKRIQFSCEKDFQTLNTEMYIELERRAGCDLNTRLRNKKQRMQNNGCKKTDINNTRKIDIIEEDKKLREIFSKIISEYEIRYCA